MRFTIYSSSLLQLGLEGSMSISFLTLICSLILAAALFGFILPVSSISWAIEKRGNVLFVRWAIDILSVLIVSRIASFRSVTIFGCDVIILYGPAFFCSSFFDVLSAFVDVARAFLSK